MDKLLSFTPEPFPELDREAEDYELDPLAREWEAEEEDTEVRGRHRPRISRKAPRRYARNSVLRRGARPRISAPRVKPLRRLPKLAPRPFPVPALRPRPIPFVPPLWFPRPDLPPAARQDVPRADNHGRNDLGRPDGSGTPSAVEPPGEPASEYIRWVQDCLNRVLGLNLPLDGVMGRETRSAVRMFQERRGLTISGLVGPETEAALRAGCRVRLQDHETVPYAEISYFPPFQTEFDQGELGDFEGPELEEDLFLGKAIRKASRAVSRTAQSAGRRASRAAKGAYKTARKGSRYAGKAYKTAARYSQPPGLRALAKFGRDVARGKNVARAFRAAAKAGIADVRDRMRYAQVVASFVPGVGTGVAAALGAANALAAGRPITDAVIEAARAAIPGGPLAQAAFDVGVNLARGRNLSQAALAAARNRLPVGARAAFDTAVALGKGKSLQQAAWANAGHVLARSPYAANALAFARRAGSARNLQHAALSPAGRRVLRPMRHELGELEYEGSADFEIPSALEMRAVDRELLVFNNRLGGDGLWVAS